MSIDLSKVNPNSMVSVLENNKDLLWSQTDKNSLIKADSVLDIYFSEETQEYLKGIDITFTQKDGSLTFNLSKVPNHTLVINTMRISKVIGSGEEQTSCEIGIIKEIETITFDYRVSGAIESKEGE